MIIEDEGMTAHFMALQLEEAGCEICAVHTTAEAALADLRNRADSGKLPDVIFTDIRLAGKLDGVTAAQLISSLYHKFIVFVSSVQDSVVINNAKNVHQSAFLQKPFNLTEAELILRQVSM